MKLVKSCKIAFYLIINSHGIDAFQLPCPVQCLIIWDVWYQNMHTTNKHTREPVFEVNILLSLISSIIFPDAIIIHLCLFNFS